MKKIACIIMALSFIVSAFAFAGCEKEAVGRTVYNEGDGSGGNLEIVISEAGFGTEWLRQMAKEFSKDNNVSVAVVANGNQNSQYISQIQNDQSPYDLVFTTGSQARLADERKVVNLTQLVYNQKLPGHEDTILNEMNPYIRERLNWKGQNQYYFIDWANSVSGIFYNMTTLKKWDSSFTEDDLPRTTNELLDLSYAISDDDGYVAWSTFAGSSYSDYMSLIWGAQYDGYDAYFDYYTLNNGTATSYDDIYHGGLGAAFDVIAEILNSKNGIMHEAATRMNYLDAQVAFAGNGYQGNNDLVAFIPSGDWMESELSDYLPNNPKAFGILKSPVVSSIYETFTDKEDKAYFGDTTEANGKYGSTRKTTVGDQRLAELVQCIDDNKTLEETRTALSYAELDQTTYDRVAEARSIMSCATMDHQMSMPITAKNQDNAVKFVLYMLSDEGQKIYSDVLGGRGMVYGYEVPEEDLNAASYMIKSINWLGNYRPVFCDYSSAYVYAGGLRYYAVNDRYAQMQNGTDAQTILAGVRQHWTDNWSTVVAGGSIN